MIVGTYKATENPDGTITLTWTYDGSLFTQTSYASPEFYADVYGGAVDQAQIAPALTKATDLIDALTFYRIEATGFAELNTRQKIIIQRVCCIIADGIYNGGYLTPGVTAYNFSLGDLSINQAGGALVNGIPVDETALSLLRSTGLMLTAVVR